MDHPDDSQLIPIEDLQKELDNYMRGESAEECVKGTYKAAFLREIRVFQEQMKIIENESKERKLPLAIAHCVSTTLKSEIPTVRRFPEFRDDERARFLVNMQMEYVKYLDNYCRDSPEDSKIPENLCTLFLLAISVVSMLAIYYSAHGGK